MKQKLLTVLALLVFNGLLVCSATFSLNNWSEDRFSFNFFGGITLIGILFQIYLLIRNWYSTTPQLPVWTMHWQRKLAISCIIVVLLAGIGYGRWVDFLFFNNQPPPLLQQSEVLSRIQHNRLYDRGGFGSGLIWRAEVAPEDMVALCRQYRLTPSKSSESLEDFFNHRPYWWRPEITSSTEIYVGTFDSGRQRLVALWDRHTEIMYARINYIGPGFFF